MNPSDFVTCTVPCAIAAGNVEEGGEAIHIAEPAFRTPRFRGVGGHAQGAPAAGVSGCQSRQPEWCEHTPLFRNWKKY
jgi:hypothetical protein